MAFGRKNIGNWTRVFTFALAVLFLLFLIHVATHNHQNGQNDPTCQLCQAAHLGSILPSVVSLVFTTPQAVAYVVAFVAAYHNEFSFHYSPCRAPPAAIQL